MLDEGLLDVPPLADGSPSPVTGAFALHITSTIPTGMVATKGGATMAAADTFDIVVKGAGGHASEPFRTVDPIPIACEIVQALQLMVTRRVDIFDPAVVTVGQITAGTTNNIIPETADDRRHHPHGQRAHADDGARQHPPRRREGRRGPRRHGRARGDPRLPGHVEQRRVRRLHPRRRPRRARRRPTCTGCPTRSWAPRTSRTSCSACPAR